jgi:tape measure domain-containing protein
MSSVESRIVTMKFDNAQFEANARTSLSTLEKIKSSMNFGSLGASAAKSLSGVSTFFSKFGLKNPFSTAEKGAAELGRTTQGVANNGLVSLDGAVTAVSSRFIALSTIAITALSNITTKAIESGTAFFKSFTFGPIMDGLTEYQTTLQSIQTVQANTDAPLEDVEASLKRLNDYSDQTIYNFGQMARNVGTFTAAGVDLKTSVASIQGIANIAALSGSSAEQAATAMYQLSQAISSGKVGLMDWNSVVNAGMGGKKLQNALAQTAIAMGDIKKSSVELVGPMKKLEINGDSFRESIMAQPGQESWLSSDILVNTLASLDGRFSVAYQKSLLTATGVRKFTDAQIKSNMVEARANLEKKNGVKYSTEQWKELLKMAEASTEAATKVKTLGQVFDIAKETIGSGWAASFKNIFGGLKEAKTLFTGMSTGLNDLIKANALARNKLLTKWHDGGGRDFVIKGLKNTWAALLRILKPIGKAFRDIFPKKTADDLISMSKHFMHFTNSLKIGSKTADNLRRTFRGVFALFDIGWQVVKGLAGVILDLFGVTKDGSKGFLGFTGNIGDWLVVLDTAIKKGGLLNDFFDGLTKVLSIPIKLIQGLARAIGSLFDGFDLGDAGNTRESLKGLGDGMGKLTEIADKVGRAFQKVGEFLKPLGEIIGKELGHLGDAIGEAFKTGDFSGVMDILKVGLLGGILLTIRHFFKTGLKIDFSGGVITAVKQGFDTLTGSLQNMQRGVQAKTILNIASAVGILTASIVALTLLDGKKMAGALTGMGVMFTEMISALVVMTKFAGKGAFIQIPIITGALLVLSAAIVVLVGAVAALSLLSWDQLGRGLAGLGAILVGIVGFATLLGGKARLIAATGLAMIPLALGISILSGVVMLLSTMKWEDLGKGLAGLAGMLAILVIALSTMSGGVVGALAILIIAPALLVLTKVLKDFSQMDWEEIGKAMVVLAGSLTILGLALYGMSFGVFGAIALLIITPALLALAGTMKILGGLSWKQIARGLVALAGAMTILAIGLTAMIIALPGALALAVAAKGLAVMAVVLAGLGQLKWSEIAKGLATLAGLFVVLSLGGLALIPAIPALLGFAIAVGILGVGIALIGIGALAFAAAFGIFAVAGNQGLEVIKKFIDALPGMATGFGKALVATTVSISEGAGKILKAFGGLIGKIIVMVTKLIPKFGHLMSQMIKAGLEILRDRIPQFISVAFDLLDAFLTELKDNIPRIVPKVTKLVQTFVDELGKKKTVDKLATAALQMIIDFLDGLSSAIDKKDEAFGRAGGKLIVAIVKGMVTAIHSAEGEIMNALFNMIKNAAGGVNLGSALSGLTNGLSDAIGGILGRARENFLSDLNNIGPSPAPDDNGDDGGKGGPAHHHHRIVSGSERDLSPRITPVLDLTEIQKGAREIADMFKFKSLDPFVSFAGAKALSAEISNQNSQNGSDSPTEIVKEVNFTQNNYSPKAISEVERYRQTKNLLSLKREELGI